MTTLAILYLIFAKYTALRVNKLITPTIMKRKLYIRALKNKVLISYPKICGRTFRV